MAWCPVNSSREEQDRKIDQGVDIAGGINGAGGLVKQYKEMYQGEADYLIPLISFSDADNRVYVLSGLFIENPRYPLRFI